jgi:hypothetical protein
VESGVDAIGEESETVRLYLESCTVFNECDEGSLISLARA